MARPAKAELVGSGTASASPERTVAVTSKGAPLVKNKSSFQVASALLKGLGKKGCGALKNESAYFASSDPVITVLPPILNDITGNRVLSPAPGALSLLTQLRVGEDENVAL